MSLHDQKYTGGGRFYPIGTPGQPWTAEERVAWAEAAEVKRSYADEVVSKVNQLRQKWDVSQYGALSCDPSRYPLFLVKNKCWDQKKPTVLITGGVHGYETSGVQGAIMFMQTKALSYSGDVNFLCFPCVSPWGYERIQRWTAKADDPNRGFFEGTPSEECAAVMRVVAALGPDHQFLMHVDCHETTDTDESEFRPAKAARDGLGFSPGSIPDGFYLVGDSKNPQADWHTAMINAVREVTHIAPADEDGTIIGEPITQEGVLVVPTNSLHLCSSVSNAQYATTTEVYPDSPRATPDICNRAQVACISAGLEFLLQKGSVRSA